MRRILFVILVLFVTFASCKSQAKNIRIRSGRPLQEQLTEENAVYLIKEQIELHGATVIMPSNSTLKFKRRGIITNGTLQGNGTHLAGMPRLDGVHLKGKYATQEFYTSWSSARLMSEYIEDVMNLGGESTVVVDCDITLNDQKMYVDHLYLKGKKKTITNSDRYYISYGGTNICDLRFRWDKDPAQEPKDNYSAVVIYWELLQKDTTITTIINNVEADGGRYCSYFMKQYKSSIEPKLLTRNIVTNSSFKNFTRGAIWTCGGSGEIANCNFNDIGYETTTSLLNVYPLRLGYSNVVGEKGKAKGYVVRDCEFINIVASYNSENDGRELHGLLAYGDSIIIWKNQFKNLSTNFSIATDTGMDSEMLYIKGSYNTIENNSFENGAGSNSDAVVTLKTGGTEGNVIRNNLFHTSNTASKFVYLGGINHSIDGNIFVSTYKGPVEGDSYCIYLSHHQQDIGKENVSIRHNMFTFTGVCDYLAVYANSWGYLSIADNNFVNPTRLLKFNKRNGPVILRNNTITLDNVRSSTDEVFISLSSGDNSPAEIINNTFKLTDTSTGVLVSGVGYIFNENKVFISKSSIHSILRGKDTAIVAIGNVISVDPASSIQRDALVGEFSSEQYTIKENLYLQKILSNTYKSIE